MEISRDLITLFLEAGWTDLTQPEKGLPQVQNTYLQSPKGNIYQELLDHGDSVSFQVIMFFNQVISDKKLDKVLAATTAMGLRSFAQTMDWCRDYRGQPGVVSVYNWSCLNSFRQETELKALATHCYDNLDWMSQQCLSALDPISDYIEKKIQFNELCRRLYQRSTLVEALYKERPVH